jgi:hypothetical protein
VTTSDPFQTLNAILSITKLEVEVLFISMLILSSEIDELLPSEQGVKLTEFEVLSFPTIN